MYRVGDRESAAAFGCLGRKRDRALDDFCHLPVMEKVLYFGE